MRVRRGSSLLAFSFVHVMVTSLYLASIYTLYYTYTNSEPILTIEPGINRVTWLVTAGRGLSPTESHEKTGTSPRRLVSCGYICYFVFYPPYLYRLLTTVLTISF